MSRSDELDRAGAKVRGSSAADNGGTAFVGTPCVSWPAEGQAWIEGAIADVWRGGRFDSTSATIIVTGCSEGLDAKLGPEVIDVASIVGQKVNVSLSPTTLKDSDGNPLITNEDKGQVLYIGFLGWFESPQSGNRYQKFIVKEVPQEAQRFVVHGSQVLDLAVTDDESHIIPGEPEATDDELPF